MNPNLIHYLLAAALLLIIIWNVYTARRDQANGNDAPMIILVSVGITATVGLIMAVFFK